VQEAQMSWRMRAAIGATYYARLNVYNKTTGKTAVYDFNEKGDFSAGGSIYAEGAVSAKGSIVVSNSPYPKMDMQPNYLEDNTAVSNYIVGGSMFFEGALNK